MTPLVKTEKTNFTQAEKRPMAQHIALGSLFLGAGFLVALSIVSVLAF